MKSRRYTPIALLLTLTLALPSVALAQSSAPSYLGLVPEDAVMAGQAHVRQLLDIDRLERLMNSWGAVLGEQADTLVAQMREEYNTSLAPFAENVRYCMVYARSFEDNAPITICEGNFSASGYTPPDYAHIQVIGENVMVTGSQRGEAVARLDAPPSGSAVVSGVTIDPSLLAHFVVAFPPEMAAMAGQAPIPLESIQYLEARVSEDPTQLGSLGIECRLMTASPEAAGAIHALLTAMVDEMPMTATEMEAVGVSADDIRGWVQLDGNAVVFRPTTEILATAMAVGIPAFLRYIEAAQAAETLPTSMPQ